MQLGLSTYTYTWAVGVPGQMPVTPLSAYDLLDKAYLSKLKCIQIADNLPLHGFKKSYLEDLHAYASARNIEVEIGTRGLTEENVKTYLQIARTFKSPLLRIVIDATGYEPSTGEVLNILRNLIPVLKEYRIQLAIENHDRFRAAEFKYFVEESDPEWIGICLDSVNSMGAGEGIDEVVKTLAPFTLNLHIKDFSIRRISHKMGFVIEGTAAGEGMLNIPAIYNSVTEFKRCRNAILELWTPPAETVEKSIEKEAEWAAKSIEYLNKIIV